MKWFVLHYSEAHPRQLFDPYDEWKKSWLGYFFVSPNEYERFKEKLGGATKIEGHLYAFKEDELERDKELDSLALKKSQRYVEQLPEDGVDDIHDWVDEHAHDYERDRFSHIYDLVEDDDAIAFFETHLVDDPDTVWMLEMIESAKQHRTYSQLNWVAEPAMFWRALELCDVERAEELPFELPESVCNIINGAEKKSAMEACCDGLEEEEAAAMLNMLVRSCRGKKTYQWTWDVVIDGVFHDDAVNLGSVIR